jgi:hypothetical protein
MLSLCLSIILGARCISAFKRRLAYYLRSLYLRASGKAEVPTNFFYTTSVSRIICLRKLKSPNASFDEYYDILTNFVGSLLPEHL